MFDRVSGEALDTASVHRRRDMEASLITHGAWRQLALLFSVPAAPKTHIDAITSKMWVAWVGLNWAAVVDEGANSRLRVYGNSLVWLGGKGRTRKLTKKNEETDVLE
ncbi:hypothetical protein [Ralstonia sp. A12]|uniref:hypothetical protein n=1 Tax=Ralstonia sp. A12 TaxID=1217052 RepID=UPI0012EE54AA|nr:hypothetical protein [Ralstonia sp. A12]